MTFVRIDNVRLRRDAIVSYIQKEKTLEICTVKGAWTCKNTTAADLDAVFGVPNAEPDPRPQLRADVEALSAKVRALDDALALERVTVAAQATTIEELKRQLAMGGLSVTTGSGGELSVAPPRGALSRFFGKE